MQYVNRSRKLFITATAIVYRKYRLPEKKNIKNMEFPVSLLAGNPIHNM
ncbi:hypothetical protein BH10BAC3_BH10BAC3_26180 [soil metagenome]